jgi:hypothetical protein
MVLPNKQDVASHGKQPEDDVADELGSRIVRHLDEIRF